MLSESHPGCPLRSASAVQRARYSAFNLAPVWQCVRLSERDTQQDGCINVGDHRWLCRSSSSRANTLRLSLAGFGNETLLGVGELEVGFRIRNPGRSRIGTI